MPRFFTGRINGNQAAVTGEDAAHIVRSLRMKEGDRLTLCDGAGSDYECVITKADPAEVLLSVLSGRPSETEPGISVTLYQGLPKADKMEMIVQKSVELGVRRIVPVLTARSVSRPDDRSLLKKVERWNRIASEAAKQCGRGILPEVMPALDFRAAAKALSGHKRAILFYENCTDRLVRAVEGLPDDVGFMVGPEGGFDEEEAGYAKSLGIRLGGLGPRILRTETAPLCALSCIMFASGNL